MIKTKIIFSTLCACILLLLPNNVISQDRSGHRYVGDSKGETYRERLIDYADIYSYDVNERTKDTIVYVRKINDYWYGIFGTANFGLSFGNFKSLVDPNNEPNMFNAIINFYSQLGTGYTFGLVGEWMRPASDLSFGVKLGAFDRKSSNIGAKDVKIDVPTFDGDYDFKAKLTYLTLNPYAKYMFPQFDGFFVTAGVDFNVAYSSLAYLEKTYTTTGYIYHKMDINEIKGKPRFLINLGVGYDFFIADFFSANNRVRITPFADFKGGTHIITSRGSNWNDLAVNIGLQIKLAPDKIKMDTLHYDPMSEIPIDYMVDIRNEAGFEFPGFSGLTNPPEFVMEIAQIIETIPEPEDMENIEIEVGTQPKPPPTSTAAFNMKIGDVMNNVSGFETSASTVLTNEHKEWLDQLANYLKSHPRAVVRIEGHSDNQGTIAQQRDRATARSTAVVRYLMSQGIARGRLFDRGRAANFPIAANNTETGRKQNRRVSIVIE